MKSKHALCPLLILSCFSLCLSPFASVREMPRRDDIPPPKSLPQNINAIWADKSPLVLILPTKEKDAKAQEAIHEYARKRSFLQRGEGAEVMPDEEPLKRDLSAKKLIIYGTGEGNLWLAKHIGKLPIQIRSDKIKADKDYPGIDLRMIMGWANPANPEKGMIIYTAQQAEDIPGINRIPHWLTQFVLARGENILKQGFFKKEEHGYSISDTRGIELPTLSQRQMKEDFGALVEIVKETMPTAVANKKVFGLDVFATLEAFRKRIAGIRSTEEFISLISEAIGSCRGSHFRPARLNLQRFQADEWLRGLTAGFVDEASVRVHENYLPFFESTNLLSPLDLSLLYFDGEYYTLHDFTHEGSIYPRGLRVLRCNGEPPAQVISGIRGRLGHMLPYDFRQKTFYTEEFYRLAEVPRNGRLEFEFQASSGESLRATFAAGSSVDIKVPRRDSSKQLKYLDIEKILYIRVPSMNPEDLDFYTSGIHKEGKRGDLKAVIIDIRNNGGGSDSVWQTVLAHLSSRPLEYREKLGIKNSQTNKRYLPRHPVGEVILSNSRPEEIFFLDNEEFLVYSDSSRLEPAKETLGFEGPIFVLSERVYSAAGSLVTLAAQSERMISVGLHNPYILGMGIDPFYFCLPNSKFIFTIEPVIDLTNCRTAEDVFHTFVEIELKPTLEEMLHYRNFEIGIALEDFLRHHDPFFKKVLEMLGAYFDAPTRYGEPQAG